MSKNLMSAYTILNNTIRNCIQLALALVLFLTGCVVNSGTFDPNVSFTPTARTFETTPSAFPEILHEELKLDWKREFFLGLSFAKEFDLYRAITCYKRALFLAPCEEKAEIEYHIVEAYYLGKKFKEIIEFYESSSLSQIELTFPALKELLIMLYDAYFQECYFEKAEKMRALLQSLDPPLGENLSKYQAVITADECILSFYAEDDLKLKNMLADYYEESKSIRKAQVLNAFLPGAGYYYVGQKQAALTSLVINALFTYAAYQFFERGYVAAGVITTSLELGWYVGGINGAGIEARAWNERVYESKARSYLYENRLFPSLMFSYAF